jgi:hypothetical protein
MRICIHLSLSLLMSFFNGISVFFQFILPLEKMKRDVRSSSLVARVVLDHSFNMFNFKCKLCYMFLIERKMTIFGCYDVFFPKVRLLHTTMTCFFWYQGYTVQIEIMIKNCVNQSGSPHYNNDFILYPFVFS